jgi:plastocyanin
MPFARLTAALVAVALLGGCGGADPPARARDGRVEIALDDFLLRPQTVRARAGRLTFRVTNEGRIPHNFRLRRGDGEPLKITTLLPGEEGTERARLPRGDYRMVCTVANHEELGMTGTLVLR